MTVKFSNIDPAQAIFRLTNYSVSMWVTNELLLNIFEHSLELRIWDSKDKVSARARFDRPKAFRLPAGQENEEDAGNLGQSSNVKALVIKQSLSHAQLQPKESREMKGALKRRHVTTLPHRGFFDLLK